MSIISPSEAKLLSRARDRRSGDEGMTLYYRKTPADQSLVFAAPSIAKNASQIRRALYQAKTWRDFRLAMPERDYRDVLRLKFDNEGLFGVPQDDATFDGSEIPGYYDGDYPVWLQQKLDEVLPLDLLERYGEQIATVHNGPYWHIEPDNEEELLHRLRERGYTVIERPDLEFI